MGVEMCDRSSPCMYGELERDGDMDILKVKSFTKAVGFLLHQEPSVVIYDRDFTLKTPVVDGFRYDYGYKPVNYALVRELNAAGWTSYLISNGLNGNDVMQSYLEPNVFLPEPGVRNWKSHFKLRPETIESVGKHLMENGAYKRILENGLYMVGDRQTDIQFFVSELQWLRAHGDTKELGGTFIKMPDPFYDRLPGSEKHYG